MVLDGLTLHAAAEELKKIITGAKVVKINMPAKEEAVLQLYTKNAGNLKLNINATGDSSSLFIGDMKKNNPKTPCAFCMLLRKYLSGAHVISVMSRGFDRVVKIIFECKDELLNKTEITLV